MRAAQFNEYGDPSVVSAVEIDRPSANEGQVVVEVHASSLNPFDTAIRAGYMKDAIPLELPVTLGGDISGVVVEVGAGVTELAVGEKVYGQANVVAGNSGAFAEFAATNTAQVAKAPANVTSNEAASLPLVGVSAVQALTEHIKLKSGQKIFIHGGSGGIGSVAIQIAKHLGAYVATTATGEQIEKVKHLGADEVIDYKQHDFSEVLHDYDAVFDTVGADDFAKSFSVLKPAGIAVSMIAPVDEDKAKELKITGLTQSTHVTTDALNKLRDLVESGIIKPHVGQVFSLDDIQTAFIARESGKVDGKVVIEIKK